MAKSISASRSEILLEAGTNEVEVFEFTIGGQHYGVNVAKVNQIIQREQVTITRADMPPPGVLGSITIRGRPVMTIDLRQILNITGEAQEPQRALMLVTQFNEQTIAFAIDGAERIHRVSWRDFEPMTSALSDDNPYVNGIMRLEERLVLVLDLEYILSLINPDLGLQIDTDRLVNIERQYKESNDIRIVFAEDSTMIRKMVVNQLAKAGFTNVVAHSNGKDALEYVEGCIEESKKAGKVLSNYIDIILTDIEMPIMDGLSLCKILKKELELTVPVVVFSSLINDQMIEKCKSVGADSWSSKPRVELIVDIIDNAILGNNKLEPGSTCPI